MFFAQGKNGVRVADRLVETLVVLFCSWTVSCHLAVATGGSLWSVVALFAIGTLSLWLASRFQRDRDRRRRTGASLTRPKKPEARRAPFGYLILLCCGVVVVAWFWFIVRDHHDAAVILWAALVAGLAIAGCAVFLAPELKWTRPSEGRRAEVTVFVTAVLCVIFALCANRPDADDSFYVNLAVAAADQPHLAVLAEDTLHGIEGLPVHLSVYRVHSLELLNGALSLLTGIPAIFCFHLVTAALFAFLVPYSYARLFRLLTPTTWPLAVVTTIIVLVAVGETHRWYGNFAFVRMWQGKSVFLSVFLPLIVAFAIEYSARPSRRTWCLLAAAQVSAVGCTSSALAAAPIITGVTLASLVRPHLRSMLVMVTGVAASAYVLVAGLLIRGSVAKAATVPAGSVPPGTELARAFSAVLGDGRLLSISILVLFFGWSLCPKDGPARRIAVFFPLVTAVLLFNPFAAPWIKANVTGPSYWRSLWVLPLPVLLVLVLLAPLYKTERTRYSTYGRLAFVLVLVGFVVFVPAFSGISARNGVTFGPPSLKVPQPQYRVAALVTRIANPHTYAVSPPEIAVWLPTFHDRVFPLQARWYLRSQRKRLSIEDVRYRWFMMRYAERRTGRKRDACRFREGLVHFGVQTVCLNTSDPVEKARSMLTAEGFLPAAQDSGFEIWTLSRAGVRLIGSQGGSGHASEMATESRGFARPPS